MIEDIVNDTKNRMHKSIESLKSDMAKIRTGRAHPSLLEHVKINYYGADTALNQLASINVIDARTLGVNAFDKGSVPDIEKGIMNADLGLNPVTAGEVIRVPLPSLTEETRKDLIKVVRAEAEQSRVAIRNIRRDANDSLKKNLKDKEIGEDEFKKFEKKIQNSTDKQILELEKKLQLKEKEIMTI